MLQDPKKAFYSNFKNKDSKMWWKTVQQATGKTTKPQVTTHTAEELNKSFHAVWNNAKQPDLSNFINQQNELTEKPNFTPEMISAEFQKLDTSKASGPVGINNNILKKAKYALKEIVTHLFNIFLIESFVSTQWNKANIIQSRKSTNQKK